MSVRKKIICLILTGIVLIVLFVVLNSMSDTIFTFADKSRIIPIYSVETDQKEIALTFDAAWGNEDTNLLLEILKEYNAPATFFMTGQFVDKYPDDVKKFYDAGHDIANHSDSHPHINYMLMQELKTDTDRCNEKIKKIIGSYPLLYRGPYGEYNNTLIEMLHNQNMYYIQWDVDSLDWKNPEPEQLIKNVVNKVEKGSIVLMHNGAKNTPEALPIILETLKNDGYKFVLVKDLIYTDNYEINHAGRQQLKR